jgi:hypothetical protein
MPHVSERDASHAQSDKAVGVRSLAFALLPVKALLLLGACLVFILVAAMTGLTTQGE